MLYPMGILNGRGAGMEYTGVSLADKGQDLDTGTKVVIAAPDCYALLNSKSIAKSGGKNTFRSLVKVTEKAQNSRGFPPVTRLRDELRPSYLRYRA